MVRTDPHPHMKLERSERRRLESDGAWTWFDLENTPHVLFLEPLIRRLQRAGMAVQVTAKPQSQTLELASLRDVECEPVGRGDFRRGRFGKVVGGGRRALSLVRWLLRQRQRPRLLVSSSRSASLAARLLGIPGVALLDYEHAEQRTLGLNRAIWLPDLLRDAPLPDRTRRIAQFYEGLKENLYLDNWPLDRASERFQLGVSSGDYLVVARPAAVSAHYASNLSQALWLAVVRGLAARQGVVVVVVARTNDQRQSLRAALEGLTKVRTLDRIASGPGLVAGADLVVGGGGTMNREAACLGVPAWSTFCGPAPRIDEQLAREGRLRWLRSDDEVERAVTDSLPVPSAPRGPYPAGINRIGKGVAETLVGRIEP